MNTEQRAREILSKLDELARDVCSYDFGLPLGIESFEAKAVAEITFALSPPASAGEGQIGEFVIALLIAAGYVTQEKVDEARKIALGHGPYEMAAPTPPATEDARADTERLDWLDRQGVAYGFEDMHEGNRWCIDGAYATVRRAIDAAMLTSPDSGKEGV